MRFFIISIITLFLFTLPQANLSAAKPRVKKTVINTVSGGTISYSSAKLSRSTNSVLLTLKNLSLVKRITYELSYTANGIEQGAMGSIAPTSQSTDSRDLYFGTCSHGVCTPHTHIQNAKLMIITELVSGKTTTKRYTIKI